MYRLVLFDMDGTLLKGRTIFHLAEKKGFINQLNNIIGQKIQPYEKTFQIALLLKGIKKNELLSLFHEISFQDHVQETIQALKKKGCIIALATDSYDVVADDVKNRLGLDYAFANTLIFKDDRCTGEVRLHNSKMIVDEVTEKIYSISKASVLEMLCEKEGISLTDCIAVGDGIVDCGMLTKAGIGIAVFASETVNQCSDIQTNDLSDILRYV